MNGKLILARYKGTMFMKVLKTGIAGLDEFLLVCAPIILVILVNKNRKKNR